MKDLDFADDVALLSNTWLVMVSMLMRMDLESTSVQRRVRLCTLAEGKEILVSRIRSSGDTV